MTRLVVGAVLRNEAPAIALHAHAHSTVVSPNYGGVLMVQIYAVNYQASWNK